MDLSLLEVLAAGGDMATIVVVYVLWKFDRRLFRLELKDGVVENG